MSKIDLVKTLQMGFSPLQWLNDMIKIFALLNGLFV